MFIYCSNALTCYDQDGSIIYSQAIKSKYHLISFPRWSSSNMFIHVGGTLRSFGTIYFQWNAQKRRWKWNVMFGNQNNWLYYLWIHIIRSIFIQSMRHNIRYECFYHWIKLSVFRIFWFSLIFSLINFAQKMDGSDDKIEAVVIIRYFCHILERNHILRFCLFF